MIGVSTSKAFISSEIKDVEGVLLAVRKVEWNVRVNRDDRTSRWGFSHK